MFQAVGLVAAMTVVAGTLRVQPIMAAATGHLVIYEAEGYSNAMAQAFEKKTGIQVSVVHLATGDLVAKIQAEGSNPHWDIAWFDGDSTMRSLAIQDLLLTHWAPSNLKNYAPLGKKLLPADHAYFPTGITAAAVIAYNTKLLTAAQAPHNWNDLLKPQYKNEIAMNDPSISGPTYPFVAGILQMLGKKKGEAFFSQLKANGLQVYPKNGPTLQALLQGQAKVIMIQNTPLIDAELQGEPVKFVYPPSGTFVLPGTLGISNKAPDMSAAKQFVQFALSQAGQNIMTNYANGGSDSYFEPIIRGVKPNPHSPVHNYIHWVLVNPIKAGAEMSSVLNWYSNNIVH